MTETSLFTLQLPTSSENDGQLYALGTVISGSTDVSVRCGRWRFPATNPTGMTRFRLYQSDGGLGDGELLASADFPGGPGGDWRNSVDFAEPVELTAPWRVTATVLTQDRYVFASGVFPVANDFLSASAAPANAGVLATSDVRPTGGASGASCFFADLVAVTGGGEEPPPDGEDLDVVLSGSRSPWDITEPRSPWHLGYPRSPWRIGLVG